VAFVIVSTKDALRSIRSDPKTAAAVFLTIAIGVATFVPMVAVLKALVVAPLPYRDASSILIFQVRDAAGDSRSWRSWFDARELTAYLAGMPSLAQSMWDGQEDIRYGSSDGVEHVVGGVLSENAFDFLGTAAAVGRVPMGSEAGARWSPTFVISHRYWMARFGADPSVVGRAFTLNDNPSVLVGVMPERFRLDGADIWRVGTAPTSATAPDGQVFTLRARLQGSASREQAEAQFGSVARELAAAMPNRYPTRFTVKAIAWPDAVSASLRPTVYLMSAAVGLLLLITGSNTATLVLARGVGRRREFAIRTALGAARATLIRQQMAENLAPSLVAAAGGLVLGYWIIRVGASQVPQGYLPPEAALQLDALSVAVGVFLSLFLAAACALTPAVVASDTRMVGWLRSEDKAIVGDTRPRLTEAFVLVQLMLSVVLIASAIVLIRTYATLTSTSLGLDPSNVIALRMQLSPAKYPSAAARLQFYSDTLDRLAAVSGVVAASTATSSPPYGGVKVEPELIGSDPAPRTLSFVEFCTPGYFAVLRLHAEQGRLLDDADVRAARRVAVVNDAFVRYYGRGQSAVGRVVRLKTLATLKDGRLDNPLFEVVGVIPDAKNRGVEDAAVPAVYIPFSVTGAYGRSFLIRTSGPPTSVIPAVRQQLWAADKSVVITDVRTLSDNLRELSYGEPRFTALLLGGFAVIALILCAIGVYGLTSHAVSRRLPELWLLTALGADLGRLSRTAFVPPLRLVAIGFALGVGVTAVAARLGRALIPALAFLDVRVLLLTGLLIAVLTGAAAIGPWRRVRAIDPAAILRKA
jgi:predicted permease